MAETTRTSRTGAQIAELVGHAPKTSFFQALLQLERLFPDAVRIGHEGPAHEERVRVRPSVSLAHPAADLEEISYSSKDDRVQVTTTFLGLYGVDSPLPAVYPDHIVEIADDPAGVRVRSFLDIFHHRLFSLLYRAWKKSRPVSGSSEAADPIYDRVLSLIGYSDALGLGGSTQPRLREARLTVLRARTAAGLESLLDHRMGYRCSVDQLQTRRVAIPLQNRTQLGKQNSQLGSSLVSGAAIIDCNKICVGVVADDFMQWQRLLPAGSERAQIDDAVESYLREPVDYDVEIELDPEHIPPWELGNHGHQLGRTCWLGRPPEKFVSRWRARALR